MQNNRYTINGIIFYINADESLVQMADVLAQAMKSIEDIENIISICLQYEANCPHEIKLRYNVKANSLDAEYEYEDFLNDEGGLVKRFEKWFQEINLNLNSLK